MPTSSPTPRQFSFTQPAAEDERFAPTAFDSQIGKVIPVNLDGRGAIVNGRVVAATVAEDGRSAEITIELRDGGPRLAWGPR